MVHPWWIYADSLSHPRVRRGAVLLPAWKIVAGLRCTFPGNTSGARCRRLSYIVFAMAMLALPALAQPEVGLAAMLRAAPAPADARRIAEVTPLFTYTRLDLLAGAAGPAAEAGMARLQALGPKPMTALAAGAMRVHTLGSADGWPTTVGFDLDAVDAALIAPVADSLGHGLVQALRVLAGAPWLHDATRASARP